jgi:flavin-dependent dehydrogenase
MLGVERFRADVCIIGAGPAGSTLAARLAALGYDVCLVERSAFPRPHLGESLSPGVLPLLEMIGARELVEAAGFWHVCNILMRWDQGLHQRRNSGSQGLLVERGHFDGLLLERAKALGVRALQPAVIRDRWRDEDGWSVRIDAQGRTVDLRAAFLADASGRSARESAHRRRTGCRTLALYAYWRGRNLPGEPRIEAGTEAWYWGVPLPDGTYNTLAFVDVEQFRGGPPAPLVRRFHELIDRSELMAGCRDARMTGRVLATDATSYIDDCSVGLRNIKVGEAALALDPLSSSGVQKAMQTALAGAVVVNTLLRRPESSDAALAFYRESLAAASERHRRWAAAHYGAVATRGGGKFWQDRGAGSQSLPQPPSPAALGESPLSEALVELSPQLEIVDLPCIEGEFVSVKPALHHPGLDGPVAYLGDWELAPLLRQLPAGMTPLQIARWWSSRVPLSSGLAIAGWLLGKGVLVQQAVGRGAK